MIWRLMLLFTIVPAMELYLLLRIGQWLGAAETVMLILVTGFVGAWLAKREGLHVLRQLSQELSKGIPPGSRLAEGALVVAGGLLLVTPGVLTDLTGFAFILPWTRRRFAALLVAWVTNNVQFQTFSGEPEAGDAPPSPQAPPRPPGRSPFDHPMA